MATEPPQKLRQSEKPAEAVKPEPQKVRPPEDSVVSRLRSLHTHEETRDTASPPRVLCPNKHEVMDAAQCEGCTRQHTLTPRPSAPMMVCTVEVNAADFARDRSARIALTGLLDRTPVKVAMSTDVHAVTSELPLFRAALLMIDHRISCLPVVDATSKPVGMLTKTDLVRDQHEGPVDPVGEDVRRVEEVMTSRPLCIPENESLGRAAALLASERVHQLSVVDDDGRLCGVLSSIDIAHWIAEQAGYLVPLAGARLR